MSQQWKEKMNNANYSHIPLISKGGRRKGKRKRRRRRGNKSGKGEARLRSRSFNEEIKRSKANQMGNSLSTYHTTSITQHKWVALVTQWAQIGKLNLSGILEQIMAYPEARDFEHCLGRWHVPKKHHHISSYQAMEEAMLHLLMDSVMW